MVPCYGTSRPFLETGWSEFSVLWFCDAVWFMSTWFIIIYYSTSIFLLILLHSSVIYVTYMYLVGDTLQIESMQWQPERIEFVATVSPSSSDSRDSHVRRRRRQELWSCEGKKLESNHPVRGCFPTINPGVENCTPWVRLMLLHQSLYRILTLLEALLL